MPSAYKEDDNNAKIREEEGASTPQPSEKAIDNNNNICALNEKGAPLARFRDHLPMTTAVVTPVRSVAAKALYSYNLTARRHDVFIFRRVNLLISAVVTRNRR